MFTTEELTALKLLDGRIRDGEGLRLAELAARVDPEHHIVEIGSYKGKSTAHLALGAKKGLGAHVTAIDLWTIGGQRDKVGVARLDKEYATDEVSQVFTDQIASLQLEKQVTPWQCSSLEAALLWNNKPIGLLFIDAEHSYRACSADIRAWSQYIVPGGYIALHDYSDTFPGVIQAAEELIESNPSYENFQVQQALFTARKKA